MLLCSVSADTIMLSDATLLMFADMGGTAASTLDSTIDIPGDPAVEYNITWANQAGYTEIALGIYNPTEVGVGDTWELEVQNLDPTYPTFVRQYMQVDGWSYHQGAGVWLGANGGTYTISIANPATSVVNALGIKIGTDDWTGRPHGSSIAVRVVPEPASLSLVGLLTGGIYFTRRFFVAS